MFRNTIATGRITWIPTQGLCTDEDVEAIQPDIGDVGGSVDDNLECHLGEKIVKTTRSQSRKRAVQSSMRQARGKKEKRLTLAPQLSTQINRLCSAVESWSAAIAASEAYESFGPYKNLINMLDTIPEIVQNEKLYFFAISHFKAKKDNRQVFMSLKGDAQKVKYLKYEFEELSHS